jgi:superfamily II DNA/RNA helicase
MGFADDVLRITDSCKRERQTLLFSATLNHRGVAGVANRLLRAPEVVTLSTARDAHSAIKQQKILADDVGHKEQLVRWLLENESFEKALVFCNTKVQVDRLGGRLVGEQLRTGTLHGDMDQFSRNRVMDLLRRGAIKVLVATDVAARGLDVKGIDLVINFEMARSGDDYTHRIGRTGRAGEQGLAVSLIGANEWNLTASIERYLRQNFEPRSIDGLEAKFKGPKKLKASGKAAGKAAVKMREKKSTDGKVKVKERLRDKKNKGKRRAPTGSRIAATDDGLAPLRKKQTGDDTV